MIEPMSGYYRKLKPENDAVYAIKPDDKNKYRLSDLTEDKEIKAYF